MISKESKLHHSIGSLIDGAQPNLSRGPIEVIWAVTVRRLFEMAEGKKEKWCRRGANPGPLA